MQSAITIEQLAEKFELLSPSQKRALYEFVDSLLRRDGANGSAGSKALLLETSVWSEQDVRRIREAQQDLDAWRIPA